MSEREGGGSGGAAGAFLLGLAVGAVLGVLFAPEEGGDARRKLSGRLRGLRELAAEKAVDLSELVAAAHGAGQAAGRTAREEVRRRLEAVRRRRGGGRVTGGAEVADEEDETLA
jgi:gas vesicle protein